jgi:hypothetical protein
MKDTVTGQVNWFPSVIAITGEPVTLCLEIREGEVRLVPQNECPSGHSHDAYRNPDNESRKSDPLP